MEIPCGIEYQLRQHQTKEAKSANADDFISNYVAERLQNRIIQNSSAGMILEALGEELELITDAYTPALIALHNVDMSDESELTDFQEQAVLRLGWVMLKICSQYNADFSSSELEEEARKEFYDE